jgi:hypothetical protein
VTVQIEGKGQEVKSILFSEWPFDLSGVRGNVAKVPEHSGEKVH